MTKKASILLNVLLGAIAGLLTGMIVMLLWMHTQIIPSMLLMVVLDQMKVYELVGQAYGVSENVIIYIGHFFTAAVLGILFSLIFQKLVKNLWRGVWLGAVFGMVWWLITPFYLMPLFFSISPNYRWSDAAIGEVVNSIISHLVFGILVGFFYAIFKRLLKGPKQDDRK